ncbi:MAG: anti-sigma factor, partial [Burkholderiales bacterium]
MRTAAAPPPARMPTMTSDTEATATRPRTVSPWWRALAILLLIVLLLAWATASSMVSQLQAQIGHLQARLIDVPQIRHVAVLLDQDQRPAMLVTHNPKQGQLLVQRLNDVREGREDSMQVWALRQDQPPKSLGVIESRYQTLQMPVSEADLQGVIEIGISAENKGGVPAGA